MCSFVLLLTIKSNLVQRFDRRKPAVFNVTVAAVLSSILKEAQCAFSILGRALHTWHVRCRSVGYIYCVCMCIVGFTYASTAHV